MDKNQRLAELEDVINTLDDLISRINSEDIKNNLISLSITYETEKQNLKNTQ